MRPLAWIEPRHDARTSWHLDHTLFEFSFGQGFEGFDIGDDGGEIAWWTSDPWGLKEPRLKEANEFGRRGDGDGVDEHFERGIVGFSVCGD